MNEVIDLKSTVLSSEAMEFIKDNGTWRDLDEYPGNIEDMDLPCILYYYNPDDAGEIRYIAYVREDGFTISGLYSKVTEVNGDVIDNPICLHKFHLANGSIAYEVIQGISNDGFILLALRIDEDEDFICGFEI